MKKLLRGQSAPCARVERTLASNRKAGLNFPGVFMEVTVRKKRNDALTFEFYDDRNITAYFVSTGVPPRLEVRSRLVQQAEMQRGRW
jgi:hypothetical protein